MAIALTVDLSIVGYTTVRSLRTHQIPMDQGQTTWRAARLLWQGEDPYGIGALVDYYSFSIRADARRDVGIAPNIPAADVEAALAQYDETLDPALRRRILPTPAVGEVPPPGGREARLVGYKYGPVIIALTAPFAPLRIPAFVVLLNAAACFGLFLVMYRIFHGIHGDSAFSALALSALLLDRHISWNYLNQTATDVWALVSCTLAVFAFRTRRLEATAAALAFAVGCKILPSIILVPLLLHFRAARPLALFAVFLTVIYLPWLAWDLAGFIDNVFLWPFLMFKDTTSWLYYTPPAAAATVRTIVFLSIGVLWFRFLTGRETRLFWTLAVMNTLLLLTGGVFHNNYVPWASVWLIGAIVEAFASVQTEAKNDQIKMSTLARTG